MSMPWMSLVEVSRSQSSRAFTELGSIASSETTLLCCLALSCPRPRDMRNRLR